MHHYISCSDTDQPTWRDRPLTPDGNAAEKSLSQDSSPPTTVDGVIVHYEQQQDCAELLLVAAHDNVERLPA
jgi:hypothetical protein